MSNYELNTAIICSGCGHVADPESAWEEETADGAVVQYCFECTLIKLGFGRFGLT